MARKKTKKDKLDLDDKRMDAMILEVGKHVKEWNFRYEERLKQLSEMIRDDVGKLLISVQVVRVLEALLELGIRPPLAVNLDRNIRNVVNMLSEYLHAEDSRS